MRLPPVLLVCAVHRGSRAPKVYLGRLVLKVPLVSQELPEFKVLKAPQVIRVSRDLKVKWVPPVHRALRVKWVQADHREFKEPKVQPG